MKIPLFRMETFGAAALVLLVNCESEVDLDSSEQKFLLEEGEENLLEADKQDAEEAQRVIYCYRSEGWTHEGVNVWRGDLVPIGCDESRDYHVWTNVENSSVWVQVDSNYWPEFGQYGKLFEEGTDSNGWHVIRLKFINDGLDPNPGYQVFSTRCPNGDTQKMRLEWKYGSDFGCLYPSSSSPGTAKTGGCWGNFKYEHEALPSPGGDGDRYRNIKTGRCLYVPPWPLEGTLEYRDCSQATSFFPRPTGDGVKLQTLHRTCAYSDTPAGTVAEYAECDSSVPKSFDFKINFL